eukprot:jgi/Tetstr1/444297/TSEL_032188.t1
MAYRDPILATPEAEHEIATGVFASTMFHGLDDFTSKLVAYFYTNAHLHGLVKRHCTKLHISHRDPLMRKSNAELSQLIRRTFDVIPAKQRYSEYTMVGVILTVLSPTRLSTPSRQPPAAPTRSSTHAKRGSEWEYEKSDEDDDFELSPTTVRVLTPPERLVKHGTVERGAAYCLPCLAEVEAFNITDVDGGQPTGLLYKIPAGTLCRPCKQDAGSHPRSSTLRQPDGRKPGVPMGR